MVLARAWRVSRRLRIGRHWRKEEREFQSEAVTMVQAAWRGYSLRTSIFGEVFVRMFAEHMNDTQPIDRGRIIRLNIFEEKHSKKKDPY